VVSGLLTEKRKISNTDQISQTQRFEGSFGVFNMDQKEYLQLLEERNRILKRLKDNKSKDLAQREQGFTTLISGANKDRVKDLRTREKIKQSRCFFFPFNLFSPFCSPFVFFLRLLPFSPSFCVSLTLLFFVVDRTAPRKTWQVPTNGSSNNSNSTSSPNHHNNTNTNNNNHNSTVSLDGSEYVSVPFSLLLRLLLLFAFYFF
jgi:hypothetical protein